MGIVDVDADLIAKFQDAVFAVSIQKLAQDAVHAGCRQQIFLADPQLSSHAVAVIRVEDGCHGVDLAALAHGLRIVTAVEGVHIDGLF